MNRKVIYLLSAVTIASLVSAVLAAVSLLYEMPMTATVTETASLNLYVDGSAWTNGTVIDWGTVEAGKTYTKSLDIKNTGNVAVQVWITVEGLPTGWSLSYDQQNSIVQPGSWLNGTLTLTVPEGAASTTYSWTAYLHVSS
ncbi:hypothetical protein DRH14_04645 [Candidatus Shapirobacteria bacterium]|nr:MAG: hypothetical protein DRH14_04645 [Candidatus Shapirobacteria bacterium]